MSEDKSVDDINIGKDNRRLRAAAIAAQRIYEGHDYIQIMDTSDYAPDFVEEVEHGFWVEALVWVDAEEVEARDVRKTKPRAAPRHRGQVPDV